jgi:mono/diheme cytochrome c family protein
MAGDDYASETVIRSEAERIELRARIEAARQREAAAAELRAREQASALADRLAREEAARSPGERLVLQHCTSCHAQDFLNAERRSRLGWWLIVLRMRTWNDAPIPADAMPALVEHFATTHRVSTTRLSIEIAMLSALPVIGWWWLRRRRRA